MIHNISKENIFDFLKGQSIIEEISNVDSIEIKETKENAKLKKVTISNLNRNSRYWVLNTEADSFQPQGNKVEKIILEETREKILNIFLIELKSGRIRESDVIKKFKNSLTWLYFLLNLLKTKENQKIQVYGILVSHNESIKWNDKSTLNILSSTSIRYKKKSFYTPDTSIDIPISDLLT